MTDFQEPGRCDDEFYKPKCKSPCISEKREEKRQKLFGNKPTGCNSGSTGGKRYDLSKIPYADKVDLKLQTEIDEIKSHVPIPDGALPPTALPCWYDLDMDSKVPRIPGPENYFYYSRGQLGEPLHRCHANYTLRDEHNMEHVVSKGEYNSLHDPMVYRWSERPEIQAFLRKQGLINDKNEVLCSLNDFNKFRKYLKTLWAEDVERAVNKRDEIKKHERDQARNIKKYLSNDQGRLKILKDRRQKARDSRLSEMHARKMEQQAKQKHFDIQMQAFQEEKNRQRFHRLMTGIRRQYVVDLRQNNLKKARLELRKCILRESTTRELEADIRRRDREQYLACALENYKIDWVDAKLEYSTRRAECNKKLEKSLRETFKENAVKRQERVEHQRRMIPVRTERRKAEERRIWANVRKFAMRWLKKVRRRLDAPKDVLHESFWTGGAKDVLDPTVQYLRDLSGYTMPQLGKLLFEMMNKPHAHEPKYKYEPAEPEAPIVSARTETTADFLVLSAIRASKGTLCREAGGSCNFFEKNCLDYFYGGSGANFLTGGETQEIRTRAERLIKVLAQVMDAIPCTNCPEIVPVKRTISDCCLEDSPPPSPEWDDSSIAEIIVHHAIRKSKANLKKSRRRRRIKKKTKPKKKLNKTKSKSQSPSKSKAASHSQLQFEELSAAPSASRPLSANAGESSAAEDISRNAIRKSIEKLKSPTNSAITNSMSRTQSQSPDKSKTASQLQFASSMPSRPLYEESLDDSSAPEDTLILQDEIMEFADESSAPEDIVQDEIKEVDESSAAEDISGNAIRKSVEILYRASKSQNAITPTESATTLPMSRRASQGPGKSVDFSADEDIESRERSYRESMMQTDFSARKSRSKSKSKSRTKSQLQFASPTPSRPLLEQSSAPDNILQDGIKEVEDSSAAEDIESRERSYRESMMQTDFSARKSRSKSKSKSRTKSQLQFASSTPSRPLSKKSVDDSSAPENILQDEIRESVDDSSAAEDLGLRESMGESSAAENITQNAIRRSLEKLNRERNSQEATIKKISATLSMSRIESQSPSKSVDGFSTPEDILQDEIKEVDDSSAAEDLQDEIRESVDDSSAAEDVTRNALRKSIEKLNRENESQNAMIQTDPGPRKSKSKTKSKPASEVQFASSTPSRPLSVKSVDESSAPEDILQDEIRESIETLNPQNAMTQTDLSATKSKSKTKSKPASKSQFASATPSRPLSVKSVDDSSAPEAILQDDIRDSMDDSSAADDGLRESMGESSAAENITRNAIRKSIEKLRKSQEATIKKISATLSMSRIEPQSPNKSVDGFSTPEDIFQDEIKESFYDSSAPEDNLQDEIRETVDDSSSPAEDILQDDVRESVYDSSAPEDVLQDDIREPAAAENITRNAIRKSLEILYRERKSQDSTLEKDIATSPMSRSEPGSPIESVDDFSAPEDILQDEVREPDPSAAAENITRNAIRKSIEKLQIERKSQDSTIEKDSATSPMSGSEPISPSESVVSVDDFSAPEDTLQDEIRKPVADFSAQKRESVAENITRKAIRKSLEKLLERKSQESTHKDVATSPMTSSGSEASEPEDDLEDILQDEIKESVEDSSPAEDITRNAIRKSLEKLNLERKSQESTHKEVATSPMTSSGSEHSEPEDDLEDIIQEIKESAEDSSPAEDIARNTTRKSLEKLNLERKSQESTHKDVATSPMTSSGSEHSESGDDLEDIIQEIKESVDHSSAPEVIAPVEKSESESTCLDSFCKDRIFLTELEVEEICAQAKRSEAIVEAITNDAIARAICAPTPPTVPISETASQTPTADIGSFESFPEERICLDSFCKDRKFLSDLEVEEICAQARRSEAIVAAITNDAIARAACDLASRTVQSESKVEGGSRSEIAAQAQSDIDPFASEETICIDSFCKDRKFLSDVDVEEICAQAKRSDTIIAAITSDAIDRAICTPPSSTRTVTSKSESGGISKTASETRDITTDVPLCVSSFCKDRKFLSDTEVEEICSQAKRSDTIIAAITSDAIDRAVCTPPSSTRSAPSSGISETPDITTDEPLCVSSFCENRKFLTDLEVEEICAQAQRSEAIVAAITNDAIARAICVPRPRKEKSKSDAGDGTEIASIGSSDDSSEFADKLVREAIRANFCPDENVALENNPNEMNRPFTE